MKRFLPALILVLAACATAGAAPVALWKNTATTTNPPQIDATAFDNGGSMVFTSSVPRIDPYYIPPSMSVFSTLDTSYFNNSGVMMGMRGFDFSTVKSSGGRGVAKGFQNSGYVEGIDTHVMFDLLTFEYTYGSITTKSLGSKVSVWANNLTNTGLIKVGDRGVLQLTGQNVNLNKGGISAGEFGTTRDSYNDTYESEYYRRGVSDSDGYLNYALVRDIYSIVTSSTVYPSDFTSDTSGGWTSYGNFSTSGEFKAAYDYFTVTSATATIRYVTVALVRTNGMSDNFESDMRFVSYEVSTVSGTTTNTDYEVRVAVELGVTGTDAVTGQTVTNAVYVIDTGATPSALVTNFASQRYGVCPGRPDNLEVALGTPEEWLIGSQGADATSDILQIGNTSTFNGTVAVYIAQVGLDPQTISPTTWEVAGVADEYYYRTNSTYSDSPTNEGARIEIAAENLNLGNGRIRAEGLLSINARNLAPIDSNAPPVIDAGVLNLSLTNSAALTLTKVIPSDFQRCRGNIYSWSESWSVKDTNTGITYNFHVLTVDHALTTDLAPTVRDLSLRSPSVTVQDPLIVTKSAKIDSKNVIFDNMVLLSNNVTTLDGSVLPSVQQLTLTSNSSLTVPALIALGNGATPLNRLENDGQVSSMVIQLKANRIVNTGSISSSNALTLTGSGAGSALFLTNSVNNDIDPNTSEESAVPSLITSGWNMNLTGASILASYCNIRCGSQDASLGVGTLTVAATSSLSDGVYNFAMDPSTALTNGNINTWEVHNGFQVLAKPAVGDLFGTTIHTMSSNYYTAQHVWPGVDRGATVAGFTNNLVIGHLVLDRQKNSCSLAFAGAGAKNAMYVDYLEFTNCATNISAGLTVASNLTIYFGACNVPYDKLGAAYPGKFVWVPEWYGPNSVANARVIDGTGARVLVKVNSMLTGAKIDSNADGVPNYVNPSAALDGTLLRLSVAGGGTLTPSVETLNNHSLLIGKQYSISASTTAFVCWVYGWDYATNDNSGNLVFRTYSFTNFNPALSFTMQSNFYAEAWYASIDIEVSPAGAGKVTSAVSGLINPDKKYTFTAVPASGYAFAGWTGAFASNSVSLSFVPRTALPASALTNLQFTANFVRKGVYNGLFTPESDPSANPGLTNSGYVTITVSSNGAVSGKVLMGSGTYPFTANMSGGNYANATVKRPALDPLTLSLNLNNDDAATMAGSVSEGLKWSSSVEGALAWFDGKTAKAAAVGYYTFVLPSFTTVFGDGFGTLKIDVSGAATLTVNNADGGSMSFAGAISKEPALRLFATNSYSGRQTLLGTLWLEPNDGSSPILKTNAYTGISGQIYWNKTNAFSAAIDAAGSAYVAPASGTSSLGFTKGVLEAMGTSTDVDYNSKKTNYASTGGAITLKLNNATGLFSGTNSSMKVQGAVLERQGEARGYMNVGGANSVSVLLRAR